MKSFKQFRLSNLRPNEFIAFSNAGGREGQYDKYDYTESYLHGQGGGPVSKEELEENLNPRNNPQVINTKSPILFDPEKDNNGLDDERNALEKLGIPDYHGTGYMVPSFNDEQAKNARILSQQTNDNDDYHGIIHPYTYNSYNLNNTLLHHHRNGSKPPNIIKSHLDNDSEPDEEDGSEIDIHKLDNLINSHRLPYEMTVYSGLHFHPNEHRGKIATLPSYLSTSLSPHVAKDFGKNWIMGNEEDGNYNEHNIKNILRLTLPKGHPHLFTDNGSLFPGQGELILPRNMRYQLGQNPTHIINGSFNSHFGLSHLKNKTNQFHIWTGRLLPQK